jgi:hypothetical protein
MKVLAFLFVLLTVAGCSLGAPSSPRANVEAFLSATQAGDYATARELSGDGDFVFEVWKGNTEDARWAGHLERYDILNEEQRGATTAYCVEFHGSDPDWPIHSLRVFVDDQGKVTTGYPYYPGACSREQS